MPEACAYLTTINKPTTNPFRNVRAKDNVTSDIPNLPNIPSSEGLGEMPSILGALSMAFCKSNVLDSPLIYLKSPGSVQTGHRRGLGHPPPSSL